MDFMRQDNGACAVHIERRSNVRFGSKADISLSTDNVRFTPKSGHQNWRGRQLTLAAIRRASSPRLRVRNTCDRRREAVGDNLSSISDRQDRLFPIQIEAMHKYRLYVYDAEDKLIAPAMVIS